MSSHIKVTRKREFFYKALQAVSVTVGVHEAEGEVKKKDFAHAIGPVRQQSALEQAQGKKEKVRWKKSTDDTVTLIEVATAQEFGIGTVPRSFIAGWFDENQTELVEVLGKIAKAGVQKGIPLEQAMKRFGAYCVGQIKQRISDGIAPELSETRKAEKMALSGMPKDTPLIFTGQLRSSIQSKVEVVP